MSGISAHGAVHQRVTSPTRWSTAVNHRVTFSLLRSRLGPENAPQHTLVGAAVAPRALTAPAEIAPSRGRTPRRLFTNGAIQDAHLRLWLRL